MVEGMRFGGVSPVTGGPIIDMARFSTVMDRNIPGLAQLPAEERRMVTDIIPLALTAGGGRIEADHLHDFSRGLVNFIGRDKCDQAKISEYNFESAFKDAGLVYYEDVEMLIQARELMQSIARASCSDDPEKVWEVIYRSISKLVSSEIRIYEFDPITGKMKHKEIRGVKSYPSRYSDWRMPEGEKRWNPYLIKLLSNQAASLSGEAKARYMELIKRLRFNNIEDREITGESGEGGKECDIAGLNKRTLAKALEENGLSESWFADLVGSILNSRAHRLRIALYGAQMERLCFTDEVLYSECVPILNKFLIDEGLLPKGSPVALLLTLVNSHEKDIFEENLRALIPNDQSNAAAIRKMISDFISIMKDIKKISDKAIESLHINQERRDASKRRLEKLDMTELDRFINGVESIGVFRELVSIYSEALKDLRGDMQRLKMNDPKKLENCNITLTDPVTGEPVAFIVANNHERSIEAGKHIPIFRDKHQEDLVRSIMNEINDVAVMSLSQMDNRKQLNISRRQAELLNVMATELLDENIPFQKRIEDTVRNAVKLCKKNGETGLSSSMYLIDKDDDGQMSIATSTRHVTDTLRVKPPKIKDVLGNPVDDPEWKPEKISGWAAQIKKTVFLSKGKLYTINTDSGSEQEVNLATLKKTHPKVHEEVVRILSDPNNTFILIPLVFGDELLGLMTVRGARLNITDINVVRSLGNIFSLAVMNFRLSEKNQELLEHEKRLARIDDLTGLLRRNIFMENFYRAITDAMKTGDDVGLIMMDADHFRRINKMFGHLGGDETLIMISRTLLETSSSKGDEGRYGGEEFIAVFPGMNKGTAINHADKIRRIIDASKISYKGKDINITVSVGVASLNDDVLPVESVEGETPEARLERIGTLFIDRADNALYASKLIPDQNTGITRNRVTGWSSEIGAEVRKRKRLIEEMEERREKAKDVLIGMMPEADENDMTYKEALGREDVKEALRCAQKVIETRNKMYLEALAAAGIDIEELSQKPR